jgi:hypothetical protein
MVKMVATVATKPEEVSSLEVGSREAVLIEVASAEVSEAAMIEVASEAVVVASEEETDITNKMMMFLRSLTTTPNKSKLALLCLLLNLAIAPTKVVASRVVKNTRNTAIVEAIIILLLIITMEADTIMAVANNLIIHLVAITNTNNELNKTTRQHT